MIRCWVIGSITLSTTIPSFDVSKVSIIKEYFFVSIIFPSVLFNFFTIKIKDKFINNIWVKNKYNLLILHYSVYFIYFFYF